MLAASQVPFQISLVSSFVFTELAKELRFFPAFKIAVPFHVVFVFEDLPAVRAREIS